MGIKIYRYTDYLPYLQDWFKDRKERDNLTLKQFSEKAGFKSHSYLQRILKGQKAVSRKSVSIFSDVMNHSEKEAEYFLLLVHFKHAKSDRERLRSIRKIQEYSDTITHNLESRRFEYFNTWYHPVVREIVTTTKFDDDFQKLGRQIRPEITTKQAHDSVKLLMELELIKKSRGRYIQLQNTVIAQSKSDFTALREYQRSLIRLGSEAIERFAKEDRNILTITSGVSLKNAERIRQHVQKFQDIVVNISNEEQPIEIAQQINVQVFPLSRIMKG